jgi:hypothetical protein
MTGEQDIVLIYLEDTPMTFARIEDISADYKPGWFQVRMLFLQVPLQVVTWILRDSYIDGDPFTMEGKRLRIEKVESPAEEILPVPDEMDSVEPTPKKPATAKVISLADIKKKH